MYRYLGLEDIEILKTYYEKNSISVNEEVMTNCLGKGEFFAKVEDGEVSALLHFRNMRGVKGLLQYNPERFDREVLLNEIGKYEKVIVFKADKYWKSFYLSHNFLLQDTLVSYKLEDYSRVKESDIVTKELRKEDVDDLFQVNCRAFGEFWAMSRDDIEKLFVVQDENRKMCKVEENGKLAAYAIYSIHPDKSHIGRLAVDPDYQGKGYGGRLLDRVLRGVEEKGIGLVTLYTQIDNENSRPLYENRGFEVVEETYVLRNY